MVSIVLRRHIPILIIWSLFLVLTGHYFFDIGLGTPTSFLKNAAIVITSFTILVGCASYVIRSISRLSNWRKETRLNLSYELFWWVVFLTFLTVAATRGLTSDEYLWLERSFYAPASSGIWAICVTLTVVVIFQKYRVRRLETALFVGGFVFLMFGRSPTIIALIPGSNQVVLKIVDLFETPINKVLLILATFGAMSLAFESLRGRIGGFE
jgi:hypothetical protein